MVSLFKKFVKKRDIFLLLAKDRRVCYTVAKDWASLQSQRGSIDMKCISWNVNGFRACLNKGFKDFFCQINADIFAIQETKMQPDQIELEFPGYYQYWNSATKKGYSGTAIFTKKKPLRVCYGMGIEKHDQEGRIITLEYPDFWFITVYTPNAQRELARLDYRMEWEEDFRDWLKALDTQKPIILCGDLNVAHREIDLKNPKSNTKNAGFTPQERDKMTRLLETGFCDSFRELYPDKTGAYSWWSYMRNARANNAGWRIDYFLVSNVLRTKLQDSFILSDVFGSDHCPVGILLKDVSSVAEE